MPRIHEGRQGYAAILEELPTQLRSLAARCLDERLARGMGHPHIGEFAPWLIADLFEVPASQKLRTVVDGWLAIYFSILLIDDLFDAELSPDYREKVLLVTLLQQKGAKHMASACEFPKQILSELDRAYDQTASAVLLELARRNHNVIPFSDFDVRGVGKKGAYLRVCFEAVASLSSKKHLATSIWPVFENLLTVLHLLDDFTDWQSDYQNGLMSLPLTMSAAEPAKDGAAILAVYGPQQGLLLNLLLTGSLGHTLETAADFLRAATETALSHTNLHLAHLATYLDVLHLSLAQAISAVGAARKSIEILPGGALTGRHQNQVLKTLETLQRDMLVVSQTT